MEENYNQEQKRKQWEEFQKYQQQQSKLKKRKVGYGVVAVV